MGKGRETPFKRQMTENIRKHVLSKDKLVENLEHAKRIAHNRADTSGETHMVLSSTQRRNPETYRVTEHTSRLWKRERIVYMAGPSE